MVELQVSVELWPLATDVGFAVRVTVGTGVVVTDTEALACDVPPLPVQASVKVAAADNAPVEALPLAGLLPDHAPEAVQDVALVELQVNVEV